MFDVSSSFDASIYPIDAEDSDGIGDKVYPEKSLPQHHVADEGGAESREPLPCYELRELCEV
jgi:hypothetical protein